MENDLGTCEYCGRFDAEFEDVSMPRNSAVKLKLCYTCQKEILDAKMTGQLVQ